MIIQEITLKNEEGLHARPATEIAKNASKYSCDIKFNVNRKEYNAKSVLNIMSAGIKNNTQIKIVCDGVDEEKALAEMVELFENLP
ncbi:MAG: HPr family phosphocarrier protein [Clostridia bacterium]|nr:HPr family phosphocarrier protein [Clostridia bacterium]